MKAEYGTFELPNYPTKREGRWSKPFKEFLDRPEAMLKYECESPYEATLCYNSIEFARRRICPDSPFTMLRRGTIVYVIKGGVVDADTED